MSVFSRIKLAWQAKRLADVIEREAKMGFSFKVGLWKMAQQAAISLVSIVASAALAALLDPAFWSKVTEGNLPPALVIALAPILHGLQEFIRGVFKHAGK